MSPAATGRLRVPAGTSVLLVLTALVFLPLDNLSSFDTVKLAALVPWLALATFLAARRRPFGADEPALRDPLLLVTLLLALAAAVGALTAWPRGSLVGPTLAVACVAAARLVPPGADGVRSTMRGAAVASGAIGIYALIQKLGLDPAPWGDRREVVATLGNTSFAAEFQAAALPLAAVLALRPGATRGDRALGVAAALLAVTHLVLAKSRIDFVAAGAAAIVATVCALPDRRKARILVGVAVAGAAGFAALFVAAAQGTIGWLGRSDTILVRVHVWGSTLRAIADAPFRFGTAPFVDLYPLWRDAEEYRTSLGRVVDTPHCDLLEIAATLGVVGAAAALAIVAIGLRRFAALRASMPWETAALAGAATAIAVSGLASSPLTHPATALILALCVGHLVALAPRPLAFSLRARAADFALAAMLVVAFWPGPALRTFRADAFTALGKTNRARAKTEDAIRLFDSACAVDPQSFEARYELGTLLLNQAKRPEALAALRSAHAVRPNDPECRTNLVHALRESGDGDAADRLLADSLVLFPWHPLLLTARAGRLSARGEYAAATIDLDRATELRPFDLRVRAVRAEARLGAAPDESSRIEAIDVLVALREARDARLMTQAARAFAARDPAFLAVLTGRARRLVPTDPALAVALVWSPIDGMTPDDPGFFAAAADVLRDAGHTELGDQMRGRSLGLRAKAAFRTGDVDGARRLAVQAGQRDPIPDHHLLEAICHSRTGARPAVHDALAAAVALGSFDADALRADPGIAALLPDPEIERLLSRGRSAAEPRKK